MKYTKEQAIEDLNMIKNKMDEVYNKIAETNGKGNKFSLTELATLEVMIDDLDSLIGDLK